MRFPGIPKIALKAPGAGTENFKIRSLSLRMAKYWSSFPVFAGRGVAAEIL